MAGILRVLVVLSAWSAPFLAAPASAEPAPALVHMSFQPIPNGPHPAQVDTCNSQYVEVCVLGIAFPGLGSDFYLYDFTKDDPNLKHVTLPADGTPVVTVLPGIPNARHSPCDGAVGSEGSVYVLTDNQQSGPRYGLHVLAGADSEWTSLPEIPIPSLEEDASGDVHAVGGARLAVMDSIVYVYDFSPITDGGTSIAIGRRLLAPEERILRRPGVFGHAGSLTYQKGRGFVASPPGGSERVLPVDSATYLGTDHDGDSCFLRIDQAPTFYIECYASDGRLLGRSVYPSQESATAELYGRGYAFLTPSRVVVGLDPEADGLHIDTWTIEKK